MARGRMISSTLGGSRKFSRLTSNDARLIYCLLLPHTDAYGRVEADPDYVKGTVLSRVPIDMYAVQDALTEMHEVGLIELYEVDDFQYAQFTDFEEHNRTYPDREAQTTIPGPDGIVPQRPPRNDSGTPSQTQDAPKARRAQDPGKTQARPTTTKVTEKRKRKVNTEEVLNPPTPQNAEPLAPPDVEATPRRASGKKPPSKTRPKFDPSTIPLPDFVSRDVWNDWVAHRHKLRKPLTERAVELTLADLAKTPLDADEMLRTSIKRGWTGVFPLDRNRPRPASDVTGTALDQYTERGL